MSDFDIEREAVAFMLSLENTLTDPKELRLTCALLQRCHDAAVRETEERCSADKKRIDELQWMTTGYGEGWICRLSKYGRGWRLYETSRHGGEPFIRDAIDIAIHERRRRREGDAERTCR